MDKSVPNQQEDMFKLVEECLASGKSKKAFCREKNIPQWRYFYWQKKYYQQQSISSQAEFVLLNPSETSKHQELKIAYPNGVVVIVPSSISLLEMKKLIQLL
jgi:hypothetical protein